MRRTKQPKWLTPVADWPDYPVDPHGRRPFARDLNAPYDKGDLGWLISGTILCWFVSIA
ncbi:unnamed protein product [Diplocarpon coronariae]